MKTFQLIFILCLNFFVFFKINAQYYMDIINLRYNYIPANKFTEYENNKAELINYNLDFTFPIELKNSNLITFGGNFDKFKAESDDENLNSLNLTSAKVTIGYLHNWKNKKWISYAEITPKLNSDLKNISANHFQLGGIILNYFKKSEKLNYQFGLFYNGETYGPFIVPLVGFEWISGNRIYASVLLPAIAIFEYKASQKIYVGSEVELTGESYRLGESLYNNSFISNFGENKLTFLVKTRLFADYYVSKNVVLYIKPGLRMFQKYEQYSEDDQLLQNPDHLSGNLKNCFYFETGIAFRFRFDETEKNN